MSEKKEYYSQIFLALRENLMRAVARIVPPKDIEDIVQESYIRLCRAKNKDDIQSPNAFLYKTARNLALDYIKRAETRLVDNVEDTATLDSLQDELIDETYHNAVSNEEFGRFCEAVRHLPVQCRRTFVLKKVYGYSQREVAKILNLSESTVEKHIAQGIKRCTYFMMKQTDNDSVSKKKPLLNVEQGVNHE